VIGGWTRGTTRESRTGGRVGCATSRNYAREMQDEDWGLALVGFGLQRPEVLTEGFAGFKSKIENRHFCLFSISL